MSTIPDIQPENVETRKLTFIERLYWDETHNHKFADKFANYPKPTAMEVNAEKQQHFKIIQSSKSAIQQSRSMIAKADTILKEEKWAMTSENELYQSLDRLLDLNTALTIKLGLADTEVARLKLEVSRLEDGQLTLTVKLQESESEVGRLNMVVIRQEKDEEWLRRHKK